MKKVFFIFFTFLTGSVIAQTSIAVSNIETVSLIFPFPIKHVDRGTKEVLVQQPKEQDNILFVKASTPLMAPTNLSVIAGDGSVYAFNIDYMEHPKKWIYQVPVIRRAAISTYANGILDNQRTIRGPRDYKWEMEAVIKGIYIKNDIIFYQLQLRNFSPIDYDIDLMIWFIRDKKKGKRTASQEIELTPLHVSGNSRQVKAQSSSMIVVAHDKITIPDGKLLSVQVMEKSGGRHLKLLLQNKHILRAIPLPDLN